MSDWTLWIRWSCATPYSKQSTPLCRKIGWTTISFTAAREWQRQLRTETRRLDRNIERVRDEENKLKLEIKAMAKKGEPRSVQMLAKQVIRSHKSIQRLEQTKCSMNAVNLHLASAIATMSTATALKASAEVMKDLNSLIRVPELQNTMQSMRQEMMRAEITDEILEEGFEESDDETEIDAEVSKVYEDLALDVESLFGQKMPTKAVSVPAAQVVQDDPLMARLNALRS